MKQCFLFFLCLPFVLASDEGSVLRYQYIQDEARQFLFESQYRSQMVTPEEIFELTQNMKGVVSETVIEAPKNGLSLIEKKIHIEEYIHNGKPLALENHQKDFASYRYRRDVMKGHMGLIDDPEKLNQELWDMNLVLPEGPVKSGTKWKAVYIVSLPMGGRPYQEIEGEYEIKKVVGGRYTIEGDFTSKISKTPEFQYAGLIKAELEFVFNAKLGFLEEGEIEYSLKLESRTELAGIYAKQVKDGTRLGQSVEYKSKFKLKP